MADTYGQLNQSMDSEIEAERKRKAAQAPAGQTGPVELPKDPDTLLNKLNELANSQQFQQEAPASARKSLAEAMDKANKAYQEKSSRNEWAEVAQLLGRSVAQLGAAREGLSTGHDMSKLDFGPGIDYGARTDRASRDYQQELSNVDKLSSLSRAEQKDTQDESRHKYSRESGVLGKALDTQLSLEREKRLSEGAQSAEESRAQREARMEAERARREKGQQDREDSRLSEADRRLQIADLSKQEESLASRLKAAETLKNQLQQEDDLSSKSAKRMEEKYGPLAASAGIDLAQLRAELASATKPGRFYGTNPDEEKKAAILSATTQKTKNLLDGVRMQKESLLHRKASAPQAPVDSSTPPEQKQEQQSPSKMRVRIKASGQTGSIDSSEFDPNIYEKI